MRAFFLVTILFAAAIAQIFVSDENDFEEDVISVIKGVRLVQFTKVGDLSMITNYIRLLPNNKLSASAATRERAQQFYLAPRTSTNAKDRTWTLQDQKNGMYVSAEDTGKKSLRSTRNADRTWETLIVEPLLTEVGDSTGQFYIRSKANGLYLVVTDAKTIIARGSKETASIFGFEYFKEPKLVAKAFSLSKAYDQIATSGDGVVSIPADPDTYAVFRLVAVPTTVKRSDKLAGPEFTLYNLLSTANENYLCYDTDDNAISAVCTDPAESNTQFHVLIGPYSEEHPEDQIMFSNYENRYIKVVDTKLVLGDTKIDNDSTFKVDAYTVLSEAVGYIISLYPNPDPAQFWIPQTDSVTLSAMVDQSRANSFALEYVNDGSDYLFYIRKSGSYLTVNSGLLAVFVSTSSPGPQHQWTIVDTGSKAFKISQGNGALAYDAKTNLVRLRVAEMSAESSWIFNDRGFNKRNSPVAVEI